MRVFDHSFNGLVSALLATSLTTGEEQSMPRISSSRLFNARC
jgi:hypothetical protein